MKREAALKSKFLREMAKQLPSFIVLSHEDVREGGHPDKSITGNGKTSWWEFKHADPEFEGREQQTITCRRLAKQGFCRYVIWREDRKGYDKRTMIVHPEKIHLVEPEIWTLGYDMVWLCDYIRKVHS